MTQEINQVFNQARVRRAFDRAADNYEQFAVLQIEVCRRLLEKLEFVKISPEFILDAGAGTGYAVPGLFRQFKKANVVALDLSENMLMKTARHGGFLRSPYLVCADIQNLPFADNTFDLVFSSLTMQWCNDLNAVLLEVKRVLKPGGLFVFSTFGPDTLKELRYSWRQVNESDHVNRFIDMHDIGDALLQHGFAGPVMEAEVITVTYNSVDEIMHDLKAIGANVTADTQRAGQQQKGLTGKSALQTVRQGYEQFRQNNVLPASYEIIYGHAWKAEHENSTKPEDSQLHVKFER
ncbi:MAG: malonyl-ACP O-methyltransferase BioC [Gammaproteobacteria bacterium]|jgi:malonyl-CoA O-methyltransferase|nr:malonyl-ACP O-methyltransferase BioC [Gammaproteobacteria bacterium]